MKSKFTLIELIVVIVVLGILAAIVIPNINSYSKEAKVKAMYADARNIETAVDKFGLDFNGLVPTEDGTPAKKGLPEWIQLEKLGTDYLKTKPKSTQYFYLEYSGHVTPMLSRLPVDYGTATENGNTTLTITFEDEEDIKQIQEIQVVQVEKDIAKVKNVIKEVPNKDLNPIEKGGKQEVQITVPNPSGSEGEDLALVIVDNAKNESPIINGGIPISDNNSGNSSGGDGSNSSDNGGITDTTGPTVNISSTTNNNVVTISIEATDSSGIDYIQLPDNSKISSDKATYDVTANGEYTFIVVDKKGNTTTEKFIVDSIMFNPTVRTFKSSSMDQYLITEQGELYGYGLNRFGDLGLGHQNSVNSWTKVNLPNNIKIKDVVLLATATLFITEGNEIYGTGSSYTLGVSGTYTTSLTKINLPSTVKEVKDNAILLNNGDLYFVDYYYKINGGQAGITFCGVSNVCQYRMTKVSSNVAELIGVSSGSLTLFKGTDQKYYASGINKYGLIPNGTSDLTSFTEISDYGKFKVSDIKDVFGTADITYFILKNGDVYVAGQGNDSNYLGLGSTVTSVNEPTFLMSGVNKIVIRSYQTTFMIKENGEVYGFGKNEYGTLGLGHKNPVFSPTRINSLSDIGVKDVTQRVDDFAEFVTKDNRYFGVGKSSYLGLDSLIPVEINLSK